MCNHHTVLILVEHQSLWTLAWFRTSLFSGYLLLVNNSSASQLTLFKNHSESFSTFVEKHQPVDIAERGTKNQMMELFVWIPHQARSNVRIGTSSSAAAGIGAARCGLDARLRPCALRFSTSPSHYRPRGWCCFTPFITPQWKVNSAPMPVFGSYKEQFNFIWVRQIKSVMR